jgi:gamma-glutamyltranspeptidase/glutathione hydrolase
VKSSAVASEPAAEQAAAGILEQEGTAAEALIAGFLAAAAARPGVLWSPLQALIAGPGTFARAFDGRARQPGLGLPRPRGAVDASSVPLAAHVAAPASLGALALLHAYDATLSFQRLARPALELAKGSGAAERRALLAKVARLGPGALRAPAVLRALLAVAGRTEGGLLSEKDLAEMRPESALPREVRLDADRSALVTPWPSPQAPHRPVEVIVAADGRGVLGVLGYAPDDEGLAVPELGITLTRDAVVVRRGIPRVAPGEVLPVPAPLAIALSGKLAFMVLGVRSPTPLSAADLAAIWPEGTVTGSQSLALARERAGGALAVGLVRSSETHQVQKLSLPARGVGRRDDAS